MQGNYFQLINFFQVNTWLRPSPTVSLNLLKLFALQQVFKPMSV